MTLYEVFDRAGSAHPTQLALDIPPGPRRAARLTRTYRELSARAHAIAAAIASRIQGETIVAIYLPRTSADAYASMLGILRAGAAYAAIDLSVPDERVRTLLDDAQPAAILTDTQGATRLAQMGAAHSLIIDLSDVPSTPASPPPWTPPSWLEPTSLAYVIYTSGTTGTPKGVTVEHCAIVNLVVSDRDHFALPCEARVGQGSSLAYDSSIEEIWLAWAAGATVVVIDDDAVRSGPDLVGWLERERVTVLCPPPTLLRTMGRGEAATRLKALSLLYVGGEALTRDVVNAWAPGRRLVNGYGPTECAVTALRADVRVEDEPIPVGWPVSGLEAHVLDESLSPVPDGEQGELCLAGVGLARGYWRAAELTAARFPMHPTLGRIYRTGDRAHRDARGAIYCHGRLDAQVKIRGHRIELEEIETHLSKCVGVQAAACAVFTDEGRQSLVAFAVPSSPARPELEDLRAELGRHLPSHGVPSELYWVDSLPRSTSGKINRSALRRPVAAERASNRNDRTERLAASAAADDIDTLVLTAAGRVAGRGLTPALGHSFFSDLGGDSVAAAELVTHLRASPATSAITVRDVYETPTLQDLAARARRAQPEAPRTANGTLHRGGRPILATTTQTLLIAAEAWSFCVATYLLVIGGGGWLVDRVGIDRAVLIAPAIAALTMPLYAIVTVVLAVWTKRAVIGRYRALRAPVWGRFYIQNWIVQRAVRRIPWWLIAGTEWQCVVLRALGARIGRRVHIHRGVDFRQGGWDLLEIGDDVSLGQDAELRLVDLDDGHVVVGPIVIGDEATLEVRAGVGAHTRIGRRAYLTALSDLGDGQEIPATERWDGVPAAPAGLAPNPPVVSRGVAMSPARWSLLLVAAQLMTAVVVASPAVAIVVGLARVPSRTIFVIGVGVLPATVTVIWLALVARLIGRAPIGVISRWDNAYVRVWIKTGLLNAANEWLSGTLLWPVWLRASGMSIGRDCEISTIIDVVPEHVSIGRGSFLADGNYLGGPCVHRGTVRLGRTVLGSGVFVGNHAVIPTGTQIGDDVLLGVSTVAGVEVKDAGRSWFGHPPFPLRRPPREANAGHVTHNPSAIRYANRLFWECLRFAIPTVPMLIALAWLDALTRAGGAREEWRFLVLDVPIAGAVAAAALCVFVFLLKWSLIGRVTPGEHALWSCWCSRWDFLYVCWGMLGVPILSGFEGTLLLPWYLRAMGAEIGRRVVLGHGFAQLVDPDMLHIGDEATVQAQLQAHTFEDRVLKVDHVRIGRRANVGSGVVLLYGADVGDETSVGSHSVVMKHERLTSGQSYVGCPIRTA